MMMSAAITPGIHPHKVKIKTIIIEPHPLSRTANGGNKIDRITLQILIGTKLQIKFTYWCDKNSFCYNSI